MKNFKQKLNILPKNSLFIYALITMIIKSVLFLGCICSESHSKINILKGIYSISSLFIYIAFLAIPLSIGLIFKRKAQFIYFLIFDLLFSSLIIFDLWNYRAFGNFISMHLLKQTANLDNLSDSIFSMAYPVDLIFITDIIVIMIISILKRKIIFKNLERSCVSFILIAIIGVSYIAYTHYRIDILDKGTRYRQLFRICWTPNQTISNLSPMGYHVFDTYNYVRDCQPLNLTSNDKKEIETWYKNKQENLPDNKFKGMFKGKNLIVIQFESLENFVINKKVNNQEITPNINKLLSNSLYFSNFHEQVHNGTSSDSDLMTNTSILPVRRGSTFFRYPNNSYNSLPNLLEDEGYQTVAIHPDKGAYWNWMQSLYSIGFNKCIDYDCFKHDELIGMGLSDGTYLKQIPNIIQKEKNPFYTFLVTLTSHSPFDLPKEYRELKLDDNLDKTKLGGYFQSIHYTDKHVGKFIDSLRKNGVLKNSVIVLYGDHCGVHKFYQAEVNAVKPSENWWLDNEKKIPLIIYQDSLKGEEVKTIGGQSDTFPTVAYLMGIPQEKFNNTVMGRNLLNTKRNFVVLDDGSYVGEKVSKEEEENRKKVIKLGDMIIRSNYFKNYKK